ncbi:hypothetical protein [Streptomyces apocyni]|uniref:hypothetical protein n=1 Tax=Streptomyces apocyni TaxID=2654677 RepID=UPI001E395F5A|nr:hypothetical protein [Streptomyces apocyni]
MSTGGRSVNRCMGMAAVGMVAAATAATVLVVTQDSPDNTQAQSSTGQEHVMIAHGKDRRPSQTAEEWVTYADHVVAVTAVAERVTPPAPIEIERGEGLTGREVTLRIDEVLWSRDGASKPAPTHWKRASMGWQFKGGENYRKMAMEGQPRVEKGHRYLMAIDWEEARCSPGDEPEPAQWHSLGEGAVVPYDNGTIGEGEMEGRIQSAEQARQALAADEPGMSLEDKLAGQNGKALVKALNAATPGQKADVARYQAKSACD